MISVLRYGCYFNQIYCSCCFFILLCLQRYFISIGDSFPGFEGDWQLLSRILILCRFMQDAVCDVADFIDYTGCIQTVLNRHHKPVRYCLQLFVRVLQCVQVFGCWLYYWHFKLLGLGLCTTFLNVSDDVEGAFNSTVMIDRGSMFSLFCSLLSAFGSSAINSRQSCS